MKRKAVTGIMLMMLSIGMLTLALSIQPVKARIITVPDDYPTIQDAINVANSEDIIYVYGPQYYSESVIVDKSVSLIGLFGPSLASFNVVTDDVYVQGFGFRTPWGFPYGRAVVLNGVSGCKILNVTVSGVDEAPGIVLTDSSNNVIAYSQIWGFVWYGAIMFERSSNNTIFENTIEAYGGPSIYLNNSSDNKFFHNQFYASEARQVEVMGRSKNVWDDDYPSGGNYWSDYASVDVKKGPGQDLPGSDGIGDTIYVIDADNVDHYPLMNPYDTPPPPTYALAITATTGGTTNPISGTHSYAANLTVEVTAIPNANYLFDHWELDTINVGSANPYTVLMDMNHTLKAVFSQKPSVSVGGYSFPLEVQTTIHPSNIYVATIAILAIVFTIFKRRTSNKT